MPYTADTFTNYAVSSIAGGAGGRGTALQAADTTCYVPIGDGAKFPSVTPFNVVLGPTEIAKCTLRSGDTLTLVRGQEGTTAGTYAVSTSLMLVVSAGNLSDVWTAINQGRVYVVEDYGAVGNGATDDTTHLQAAINAAVSGGGGIVLLGPHSYAVTAPLILSSQHVMLAGSGRGTTTIAPLAGFSGAAVVSVTADFCVLRDLAITFASTTYSSNPAVTAAVEVSGAQTFRAENVEVDYANGWSFESASTSGRANYWATFTNCRSFQSKQGFHLLGTTGTGYNMGAFLINCDADQVQNGDCYLFEDVHDVTAVNLESTHTAGSAVELHIKGNTAALYCANMDLGPSPGPVAGSTCLIESGTNGSPIQIGISNSILGGSSTGITISAGNDIGFDNVDILNNGTYGLNITGGDRILVRGCRFNENGSSGTGTRYDFQSSTTGHVLLRDCVFATPQGSGVGDTTNVVNVTAGTVEVVNSAFLGTGYTSANIFAGLPTLVRGCGGYNPIGKVTAPTFPGTTVAATNATGVDVTVFVANGTAAITVIQIAGQNGTYNTTGMQVAASGWASFRLPVGAGVKFTYASGTPTWTWFGD